MFQRSTTLRGAVQDATDVPPMALEHTKDGQERMRIDLPRDKPHHFVGKNPISALKMDHPTVSRIHAVRPASTECGIPGATVTAARR